MAKRYRVAASGERPDARLFQSDQGVRPMKKFILAVGLLSLAGGAFAAGKPCEELKSEIAAKLDAKGVSGYSLEIVDKGAAAGGDVVGTCEGGTKDIVYKRG
jgi:hypothetical protein